MSIKRSVLLPRHQGSGWRVGKRSAKNSGMTLLEVSLSMSIVAVVLLGTAAAFSSNLFVVDQAKRMTGGTLLLETVMEDLSAQNFGNLLVMNGNQFFDGADAASSEYSVDLTVFQAQVNLLQVNAVLTDLRTGREVGRVTSLRSAY